MTDVQERAEFERYSRGEITRRELETLFDRQVLFTETMRRLYDYGLPMPRPASDPGSRGVLLFQEWLSRGGDG